MIQEKMQFYLISGSEFLHLHATVAGVCNFSGGTLITVHESCQKQNG